MEIALHTPLGAIHPTEIRSIEESRQEVAVSNANTSDMMSIDDVVAGLLRREESALSIVYDRYGQLVYAIAFRITCDYAIAEEVVQDVFQAVWQSTSTFKPQSSFVGWLIGIARHRAIDATRARRYRARAREDVFNDALINNSIDEMHEQHENLLLRETVRGALAALPLAQRQAITLAYYGGLTQEEIAICTGEPVGTVKSRMRRGLMKLRDLLDPMNIDE